MYQESQQNDTATSRSDPLALVPWLAAFCQFVYEWRACQHDITPQGLKSMSFKEFPSIMPALTVLQKTPYKYYSISVSSLVVLSAQGAKRYLS